MAEAGRARLHCRRRALGLHAGGKAGSVDGTVPVRAGYARGSRRQHLNQPMANPGREVAPSFFSDLIDTLTERGRALLGRLDRSAIPQVDLTALGELLLSRRGEASGVALAQALIASYKAASEK